MTPLIQFLKALPEVHVRPKPLGMTVAYLACAASGVVAPVSHWQPAGASSVDLPKTWFSTTEEKFIYPPNETELPLVYVHVRTIRYFRVRQGILTVTYASDEGFQSATGSSVEARLRYVKHGIVYRSVFNNYLYASYQHKPSYLEGLSVIKAMLSNGPLREGK